MILIVQKGNGPRHVDLVARLTRDGQSVRVVNCTAEAFEVMQGFIPELVIIEDPPIDRCPHLLCGWIGEAIKPAPRLLGIVRVQDPDQRLHCGLCPPTLLAPDTDPSLIAATALTLVE